MSGETHFTAPASVRADLLAGCDCGSGSLNPEDHADDCPARARLEQAFAALDAPEVEREEEAAPGSPAPPPVEPRLFDAPRQRQRKDFQPS